MIKNKTINLRQIKAQIQHPNDMHRLYKSPVYSQVNCCDCFIGIKRTAGLHALKILLMYYMKLDKHHEIIKHLKETLIPSVSESVCGSVSESVSE